MVPLLTLVLLLIRGGNGQIELQPKLNAYIGKQLNEFRALVANGSAYKLGGHLPSTLSMFTLSSNSLYVMLAQLNSQNCTKGNNFPPGHFSMNFYSTSSLPSSITSEDVADVAIGQWKIEPYLYAIGDDVKYTNTKLQDFANMIYYQTTEFGCHYQVCTNNIAKLPISVLACVFNNAPEQNEPLYIASTEGRVDGCNFDSDCQEYVPFSKCTTTTTSNSYKGLCYTTNVTTFITSTTVTASTPMSTTASATTAFVTTATESGAASSTMTESTAATSATTEAASTTAEATTMAFETTSTTTETTTTASEMASTTTEATTTASTTTSATTATTTPPSPMTETIRLKIIDMHNYRRSRLAQGLVPNGLSGKNAPQGMNIYEMESLEGGKEDIWRHLLTTPAFCLRFIATIGCIQFSVRPMSYRIERFAYYDVGLTVKYNMDLERAAQNYADECPIYGTAVAERKTTGENYAYIPTANITYYEAVFQAVQSFWREIKKDTFDEEMILTARIVALTAPLKFSQMAWATTYQVGCGARHCQGFTAVVCRYYPRGNIIGDKIYNVGKTCAQCTTGCTTAYLYKGLCNAPS